MTRTMFTVLNVRRVTLALSMQIKLMWLDVSLPLENTMQCKRVPIGSYSDFAQKYGFFPI